MMDALQRKGGQLVTLPMAKDDVAWLDSMTQAHVAHHMRRVLSHKTLREIFQDMARDVYLQGLCDGAVYAKTGKIEP